MDNNNMNNELIFLDYPPELIQAKLKLCINYEAKYGQSHTVISAVITDGAPNFNLI